MQSITRKICCVPTVCGNESAWSSPEARYSGAENIVCPRVHMESSTMLPGGGVGPRLLSLARQIEAESETSLCPVPPAWKLVGKEEVQGSSSVLLHFLMKGPVLLGLQY